MKGEKMYKLKSSINVGCLICDGLKDGIYRYRFNPEFEAKLHEIKDAGFDAVTLDVCGMAYAPIFEEYSVKACEMVKQIGLEIESVHFPFCDWVDFASPWENDRQEIIKWVVKMGKILEKYNVRCYVFHPGGSSCKEETRAKFLEKLTDSASQIAKQLNTYICVENMVGGTLLNTASKLKEYADNCGDAKVVIDVNHLLHDKQEDAIRLIGGDKLKMIHISDYDGVYERHFMPGEGVIDWMAVIGALEEIGFDGAFNFEIRMGLGYTYKQAHDKYEELFAQYNAMKK